MLLSSHSAHICAAFLQLASSVMLCQLPFSQCTQLCCFMCFCQLQCSCTLVFISRVSRQYFNVCCSCVAVSSPTPTDSIPSHAAGGIYNATTNMQTTVSFTITVGQWQELLPSTGSRLKSGWTQLMYDGFHPLYDTCALTFKQNYLRHSRAKRGTGEVWTGYTKCAIGGCIRVKFVTSGEPDASNRVLVSCSISGSCTHRLSPICT